HLHPDDRATALANTDTVVTAGRLTHDYRFQHKDGHYRWMHDELRVLRDDAGKPVEVIGAWVDITERRQAEEALRQAEEKYRSIFENSVEGIFQTTPEGRLVTANPTLARMLGYDSPEAALASVSDVEEQIAADPRALQTHDASLREKGSLSGLHLPVRRKDGTTFWASVNVRTVREADGKVVLYEGTVEDITSHKRDEEALREYADRLKTVHDVDRAILAAQSPEETAQAVTRHLRQLLPCECAGVVEFDFTLREATVLARDMVHPALLEVGKRFPLPEVLPPGSPLRQSKILMLEDLSTSPFRTPIDEVMRQEGICTVMKVPLMVDRRLLGCLSLGSAKPHAFERRHMGIAREVGDSLAVALQNARLFKSVSAQRQQLRGLALRLAELEEAERRRMARELHDRVGQNLTALGINLNILRGSLGPEAHARSLARLDDSLALLEDTGSRIRDVMAELRPALLDDYGLGPALRWFCAKFAERTRVAAEVASEDLPARLPPATETALFRIAQEALSNVARHARAKHATVELEEITEGVRMTVVDDGVGFDPQSLGQAGAGRTWGWLIMQERAQAVGGQVRLESTPGQGTRVIVEVRRTV
ncbi:MAG: PAS domain S-box protein, partial [Planctomycetes bacterium]|nr:PAS domain S-box protein [Planctomycetota bacterium]